MTDFLALLLLKIIRNIGLYGAFNLFLFSFREQNLFFSSLRPNLISKRSKILLTKTEIN